MAAAPTVRLRQPASSPPPIFFADEVGFKSLRREGANHTARIESG